jgi:hypothetical protein
MRTEKGKREEDTEDTGPRHRASTRGPASASILSPSSDSER